MLVAQLCPTLCDPMDFIAYQVPLSIEFSITEDLSPFQSTSETIGKKSSIMWG